MSYSGFVTYCVKNLVDEPEKIKVEEFIERGNVQVHIHAPEGEMGKIIGRSGRIINALRQCVTEMAYAKQEKAYVKVVSEG